MHTQSLAGAEPVINQWFGGGWGGGLLLLLFFFLFFAATDHRIMSDGSVSSGSVVSPDVTEP